MAKISVTVKPNSKKEGVEMVADGHFVVRVRVPPIEGRANERVVELLAEYLGLPKSKISVTSGLRGRKKIIAIDDR